MGRQRNVPRIKHNGFVSGSDRCHCVLEGGRDYMEEDCSIRPKFRALASARLQELLGSKTEAEAVLGVLGWC